MRTSTTTMRRFATSSAAFARDAALYLLALVPWLAGLLVGLVVALVLWWLVAAMDGYRVGRNP